MDKDINLPLVSVNVNQTPAPKPNIFMLVRMKNTKCFVAIKLIEGPSYITCIGFHSEYRFGGEKNDYKEELQAKQKEDFIEVKIPWNNISEIVNLNYVYKG